MKIKFASFFVTIVFHGFLFCQSNAEYNGQTQNNIKVEQLQLKKQSLKDSYDSSLVLALHNSRVAKSELQELKKSKNIIKDLMSSFYVDDEKFKAYLLLQKEKIINPESVKYNSYLSYLNKTFVSASEILLITHNGFFCGFEDSSGRIIDCVKIFFSEEQQQKIDKYIVNGKLAFIKSNQELLESLTGVSTGYLYLKNEYERLDIEIIAKVSQLNRIEISTDELHKQHEKELRKIDNEIDLILKPNSTTLARDDYEPNNEEIYLEVAKEAWEVEIAEEDAEFPGGYEKLAAFINETINYPDEAIELGVKGRVVVRFVVEKDGRISNASVERPIVECPACNKEALNIINKMPKWTPAKNAGRPVRLWVRVPINFDVQ